MDALERFRLTRVASPWLVDATGRLPQKKQGTVRRSPMKGPPVAPELPWAVFRESKTERRVAKVPAVGDLPGPVSYSPKLTATGREHEFVELNGAETMKMSAFANTFPARGLPEYWGKIGEQVVARPDKPPPAWPGPCAYQPKMLDVWPCAKFSDVGRDTPVVGTIDESGYLGPGHYDVKTMTDGREWSFADLNGAELMKSSVFHSQTRPRASPQQWASAIFAPNQSLPSNHYIPGPGSYQPTYATMDGIAGETAERIRRERESQGRIALELRASAPRIRLTSSRSSSSRIRAGAPPARSATAPSLLSTEGDAAPSEPVDATAASPTPFDAGASKLLEAQREAFRTSMHAYRGEGSRGASLTRLLRRLGE